LDILGSGAGKGNRHDPDGTGEFGIGKESMGKLQKTDRNKGLKRRTIRAVPAAVLLFVLTAAGCGKSGFGAENTGVAVTNTAVSENAASDVSGNSESADGSGSGEAPDPLIPGGDPVNGGEIAIDVIAANDVGNLAGAEVVLIDANGARIDTRICDALGGVVFAGVSEGEYTVSCEAEGYHGRNVTVAAVSKERSGRVVPLVPESAGAEGYALLEWRGEDAPDLDLCLYDEETGEYTNAAHPTDRSGNVLYADRDASDGYELLFIREYTDGAERSVYVADRDAAQQILAVQEETTEPEAVTGNGADAAASRMEQLAVDLYLYAPDGGVTQLTPDPKQDAPLWRAAQIKGGTVTETAEYITDLSQEKWLSMQPEDQIRREEIEIPAWKNAYLKTIEEELPGICADYGAEDAKNCTYSVLRIDDDGIPEIAVTDPAIGVENVLLLSYTGERIVSCYRKSEHCGWQFIPESGKILFGILKNSRMEYELLLLSDGKYTTIKSGYTDAYSREGAQLIAYPEGQERCEWGGVPITGYINFEETLKLDFDMTAVREPDVLKNADYTRICEYLQSGE